MKATIWHNPDCGTSRKALAILQTTAGVDLTVIEYKKTPFDRAKLVQLFADAGLSAREALRTGARLQKSLAWSRVPMKIAFWMKWPPTQFLVERPFVESGRGVRLLPPA